MKLISIRQPTDDNVYSNYTAVTARWKGCRFDRMLVSNSALLIGIMLKQAGKGGHNIALLATFSTNITRFFYAAISNRTVPTHFF